MVGEEQQFLQVFKELDSQGRANLRAFLQRELAAEYSPKLKNKALKFSGSLESLVLDGEDIRAMGREKGEVFRAHITFPLFDLTKDVTKVQCSCLEKQRQTDVLRCHHLYFIQDLILRILDHEDFKVSPQPHPPSPIEELLSIWFGASVPDGERELFEVKWRVLLDPEKWHVQMEKRLISRFQDIPPEIERFDLATWIEMLDGKKSDLGPDFWADIAKVLTSIKEPEAQIFTLLDKTLHLPPGTLGWLESGEPLICVRSFWKLQMRQNTSSTMLSLVISDDDHSVDRWIPDHGVVAWKASSKLYLAPVTAKEAPLVDKLVQWREPVTPEHLGMLARLASHLGPKRVSGWAGNSLGPARSHLAKPPSPIPLLRLTPFKKGGMKIQVMIQWWPEFAVTPGEGPEIIRDFSGRSSEPSTREIARDFALERTLASRLIGLLDLEALPEPEPWTLIAYLDDQCLDLVGKFDATKKILDFCVEWPAFLARGQVPYKLAPELKQPSLHVSVSDKKDWLQVEGWLELDDGTKIGLREMLAALRREQKYLRLPDSRWAQISAHFKERLAPLVAATEEDPEEGIGINLSALASPQVNEALATFPFAEASRTFWLQLRRMTFQTNYKNAPLPRGLKAALRPYQIEGYQWLQQRYHWQLGVCLADDMGLGKTLQTLAVLLQNAANGPSLVVAPSSLAFNWAAEAQKFCPTLKVTLLRDLPGRGLGANFAPGELVIGSYGLLLRHGEHLGAVPWNILVLDEAQHLKNGLTKTAQAVMLLKAKWTLALSGTPLENRLSDLWSLFRIVSPGVFGPWERFRRSYVFPIEKGKSREAMERLRAKLHPLILRRMKKDHLHELPPKTEVDLWVNLSSEELRFYEALRDEAILKVKALDPDDRSLDPKRQITILAALTRLRQASCHRQILDPNWTQGSTKIDLLRDRILELKNAGHSALVFSQFTRFLRLIHQDLMDHGVKLLYLDGTTSPKARQEIVSSFQSGEADVLLISLKAGGTGLNLTRASYVFHMDPWWNPAVENQASDRAHRIGQSQAVTIYRFRARQTIEEQIHELHGDKKSLMRGLFGTDVPLVPHDALPTDDTGDSSMDQNTSTLYGHKNNLHFT